MSLRSRALLIGALVGAVVVGIVLALLIGSAVSGGEDPLGADTTSPTPSSPPSAATPSGETTAGSEDAGPAADLAPGIQQDAADFLAAYSSDADEAAWTKALTPLATPEMLASLTTSDRGVAASLAGTTVGEPQGSQVPVRNGADTIATLHLVQVPENDEGAITEDTPWQVSHIDFTSPPEATALPLSSLSNREIAAAIQPAVATVLAQPGGLTDQDRAAQISAGFTDADEALDIKRAAGPDKRITMGNIHDVQLGTDQHGNLTATVVAPWQIDGETLAQWTTLTVTLTRDDAGTWAAVDATNT